MGIYHDYQQQPLDLQKAIKLIVLALNTYLNEKLSKILESHDNNNIDIKQIILYYYCYYWFIVFQIYYLYLQDKLIAYTFFKQIIQSFNNFCKILVLFDLDTINANNIYLIKHILMYVILYIPEIIDYNNDNDNDNEDVKSLLQLFHLNTTKQYILTEMKYKLTNFLSSESINEQIIINYLYSNIINYLDYIHYNLTDNDLAKIYEFMQSIKSLELPNNLFFSINFLMFIIEILQNRDNINQLISILISFNNNYLIYLENLGFQELTGINIKQYTIFTYLLTFLFDYFGYILYNYINENSSVLEELIIKYLNLYYIINYYIDKLQLYFKTNDDIQIEIQVIFARILLKNFKLLSNLILFLNYLSNINTRTYYLFDIIREILIKLENINLYFLILLNRLLTTENEDIKDIVSNILFEYVRFYNLLVTIITRKKEEIKSQIKSEEPRSNYPIFLKDVTEDIFAKIPSNITFDIFIIEDNKLKLKADYLGILRDFIIDIVRKFTESNISISSSNDRSRQIFEPKTKHIASFLLDTDNPDEPTNLQGGNKQLASLEIKDIYEYYYKIGDNNEIKNELLEIFDNDSSCVVYLLYLIIYNIKQDNNKNFKRFFNDLQELLDILYDSDVLLLNYYDTDEIIFYIFMIYIYNNFRELANKSSVNIKITIVSDSLKLNITENYANIYNKLEHFFLHQNKNKFIAFLKKNLNLEKIDAIPKNKKKNEYILSFIYNYSQSDNNYIEGYDNFLTFSYINILNKLTKTFIINGNKYDNTLPTLDIYSFTDLTNIKMRMTRKQEKTSIKLLKNHRDLLKILQERYKPRNITELNTKFILNKSILDYVNSINNTKFLSTLPIIDFNSYLCDNGNDNDNDNENDNIEENIFYFASKENEKSINVYVKLVKYYLLGLQNRINKKILDFAFFIICRINNYLDKKKIEDKLVKELSKANIEIDLRKIKEFINPRCEKILDNPSILDLLYDYYDKLTFETTIRYLTSLYEYDHKNKLQNRIQDLIDTNKIIYGGGEETTTTPASQPTTITPSIDEIEKQSLEILSNEKITDLEDKFKKIDFILKNDSLNIEKINEEYKTNIAFNFYTLIPVYIADMEKIKADYDKKIVNNKGKIDNLTKEIDRLNAEFQKNKNQDLNTQMRPLSNSKSELEKENDKYRSIVLEIENNINSLKDISDSEKGFVTYDDYQNADKYSDITSLIIAVKAANNESIKAKLKNKLEEQQRKISNFKNIITTKEIKKIDKIIETTEDFYKPIGKVLESISNNKIVQSAAIISDRLKKYYDKNILGEYKDNPTENIKKYFESYKEVLNMFVTELDDILDKYKRSLDINSTIKRGGGYNNKKIRGGGKIDDEIKKMVEKKAAILDDLNNISANLKKIKANRELNSNSEKKMATQGFIDAKGMNVFENLLSSYEDNIKNKKMPYEMAQNLFYKKAQNLNLDPEEELALTTNDKVIFCVVVYVIRLCSLYVCYFLIKTNTIRDITTAIKYYITWYIFILLIVIGLINIDAFKMRILFNYLNMHNNSFAILIHVVLMLLFGYLMYLMTINILGKEPPAIELGENEKIKLQYKLELLSIIIFIFICILVSLII